MRKISLVFGILFLTGATISAIGGQLLPMLFNVIIAGIWFSVYVKLPSTR